MLTDGDRAERFLALTGLTPDTLRASLTDPAMQVAVLDFLANHEADLVAAADALEIDPATLIAARENLS